MNKNNPPKEILEKLKSSKKILISLHDGPDGDSLGSCAAMKYFLERDFGKKIKLISPEHMGETFRSFSFYKEVDWKKRIDKIGLNEFDLILFLDFGALKYYSEKDNLDIEGKFVINIDHHATNSYFGNLNYVNPSRISTCSILIDLFKKWKVNFDKELATRLLLGVYTDSSGFSLDLDSLKAASFLVEKGADYLKVVDVMKYSLPLNLARYFAFITNEFRIVDFKGCKVGISSVSLDDLKEVNLNLSEVRAGINYLQRIGGVDFLFTLIQMGDFVKGSFRSRKGIDVSLFAKELGGGGHKLAAAFRLGDISLKEAEKKVFDAIKKVGIHKVR